MATIDENRRYWQEVHDWSDGGERWSEVWGGSEAQWQGSILPRIRRLLPARRILEIGCGFGRWSRRLRRFCDELVLVDLVPACLDACRSQFASDAGVSCLLTEGATFPSVGDGAVDLVFSFDSLVHAEVEVLSGYMHEIARVLSERGAAFLHHSNMAEVLADRPDARNLHWRGESVGAGGVRSAASEAGLVCLLQEIVDWGGVVDGDCFSTVVRQRSGLEPRVERNPHFMGEAQSGAIRSRLYGPAGECVVPAPPNRLP